MAKKKGFVLFIMALIIELKWDGSTMILEKEIGWLLTDMI